MDFRTCKLCRRIFKGISALCPACAEALDQKYITVRNFLDKNKEADVRAVSEATEVDEKSILYLIREGRIALRGESSTIGCLKCGKPVLSGRYCDKCMGSLVQDLESTRTAMQSSIRESQTKVEHAHDGKNKIHVMKDR